MPLGIVHKYKYCIKSANKGENIVAFISITALSHHSHACTVFSSMTAKSIIATVHDAAEITELKLTTCSDLGTLMQYDAMV